MFDQRHIARLRDSAGRRCGRTSAVADQRIHRLLVAARAYPATAAAMPAWAEPVTVPRPRRLGVLVGRDYRRPFSAIVITALGDAVRRIALAAIRQPDDALPQPATA